MIYNKNVYYRRLIPLLCISCTSCLVLTIRTCFISMALAKAGISFVSTLCVASNISCSSSGIEALYVNQSVFILLIKINYTHMHTNKPYNFNIFQVHVEVIESKDMV